MHCNIPRFLIPLLLVLAIVLGQGFAAVFSLESSCCNGITIQECNLPCCDSSSCTQKQKKAYRSSSTAQPNCQCSPLTNDMVRLKAYTLPSSWTLLASTANPNPVLSLQLTDTQAPIWLYRLFYPDQSKLYLQNRTLLL